MTPDLIPAILDLLYTFSVNNRAALDLKLSNEKIHITFVHSN